MHRQVLLGLCIRHAAIPDQPNSLKLELPRKLPPLHDAPPVPLKHLTRCIRNRVQASVQILVTKRANEFFRKITEAIPRGTLAVNTLRFVPELEYAPLY